VLGYLTALTRFVISDIRSHPAKAQGSANEANFRLLADLSRGIANRMTTNAAMPNNSIVIPPEYASGRSID
jgi:hypothetical protein